MILSQINTYYLSYELQNLSIQQKIEMFLYRAYFVLASLALVNVSD